MTPLAQLERWVGYGETDGFLTFHFMCAGSVELRCGAEVTVPGQFIDCPHIDHEAMMQIADCDCPDTGWIAEFNSGALAEGSSYPGDHCEHVWAFGLTFDEACANLLAAIRLRAVCDCSRKAL